jgi:hypothetical protein
MTFLFGATIENSYPTITGGVRIDQLDRGGHYARWEEDFALVRDLGLDALRYGPAYYRTHIAPDQYEWESCDEPLLRLRDLRLTVIADLCHGGVPSWLGGFQDAAFPVLFAEYARAFARRYPWITHFTPVSDIFTTASYSALRGLWNECQTSDATFVRALRNLCMAHELAVEAIVAEQPAAIIVHDEAAVPGASHVARLQSLPLDLISGHELAPGMAGYLNRHGVTSNDLSFFRERRAIRQRWISAAAEAPLEIQWDHARALGPAVDGFLWSPLTDWVDWRAGPAVERNTVHAAGLFDLDRRIRPAGKAYGALVARAKSASGSSRTSARRQSL